MATSNGVVSMLHQVVFSERDYAAYPERVRPFIE